MSRLAATLLAVASGAPALAQDPIANMTACRNVAAGFKSVSGAMRAGDTDKARAKLTAAERVYFEDSLAVFTDTERPHAAALFAEVGTDPGTLVAELRACLRDNDCAEGLDDRLARMSDGLGSTCQRDMIEEMN